MSSSSSSHSSSSSCISFSFLTASINKSLSENTYFSCSFACISFIMSRRFSYLSKPLRVRTMSNILFLLTGSIFFYSLSELSIIFLARILALFFISAVPFFKQVSIKRQSSIAFRSSWNVKSLIYDKILDVNSFG